MAHVGGEAEGVPGRALRADARRNRARILAAAETVFAANGVSASTEEVAREAGVGVGTVFRHFPTKEALLEAVLTTHITRLAERVEDLATHDDPGEAFFTFVTHVAEQSAAKNAYADALAEAGLDPTKIGGTLRKPIETLLARAQHAGAVRDDVRLPEIIALMVGVSRAAEHATGDPATRARALTIVLDGLRARGAETRRRDHLRGR